MGWMRGMLGDRFAVAVELRDVNRICFVEDLSFLEDVTRAVFLVSAMSGLLGGDEDSSEEDGDVRFEGEGDGVVRSITVVACEAHLVDGGVEEDAEGLRGLCAGAGVEASAR
jgi:hypothetical protein